MNKMFEMIMEKKDKVFKIVQPGQSVIDIKKRYSSKGEFVRIKAVTSNFPISMLKVINALKAADFGEPEIEVIKHLVSNGYEKRSGLIRTLVKLKKSTALKTSLIISMV